MINVQAFLEERYPDFVKRHKRIANNLARFLGFLFYESRFQQFERDYPDLEGFDFVDAVLNYFDFKLRTRENERQRIPAKGRVVIVANHPIGSLDGLALLKLVREVRPDVRVMANEVLSTLKPLEALLLPVNNMGGNTARTNLKNIKAHLDDDGALIVFPAGEVSRLGATGIKDGEWHSGFVKIAKSTKSPVLPIFVAGRNSLFFYSISFLAKPLSTLWLVREMFKQSHNVVDARVGSLVPYAHYSGLNVSKPKLSQLFRKHVYRLAKDGRPIFQTEESIAYPENRLLLKRELEKCEVLGETPDGKQILLYKQVETECIMRELGRLRELTFRAVGEGTGLPRDVDRFDKDYYQLILWDANDQEIAGAYRLGCVDELRAKRGWNGLYTKTLFGFGDVARQHLANGIELGRSFVQPKYQNRRSLDYLWYGIGAFLKKYPTYRYLFGPVSISRYYGKHGTSHLAFYYGKYFGAGEFDISASTPFVIDDAVRAELEETYRDLDADQGFKVLREKLSEKGLVVPPLYKHYMEAAYSEGVHVCCFNVDADFGDCVDGFLIIDLLKLKPKKQKRYLGKEDFFRASTEF